MAVNTGTKLGQAYLAISRLPISEADRETLRQKVRKYSNECGCSMGSVFLVAAIAGLVADFLFVEEHTVPPLWGAGLLFIAATAGKLIGIAAAKIRLFLLCRRLQEEPSQ